MTSKDSDQPIHPLSMGRLLVYPSWDSPQTVEGTCYQRRLWSDCVNAQADFRLRWSHKSYCRFCRALAQFFYFNIIGACMIALGKCFKAYLQNRSLCGSFSFDAARIEDVKISKAIIQMLMWNLKLQAVSFLNVTVIQNDVQLYGTS